MRFTTKVAFSLSIVLLLTMILSCSLLSDNMAGMYVAEKGDFDWYINLRDDGTYELAGYTGTWQKSGDTIIITSFLGAESWQIEGENIISPDGTLYIKQ